MESIITRTITAAFYFMLDAYSGGPAFHFSLKRQFSRQNLKAAAPNRADGLAYSAVGNWTIQSIHHSPLTTPHSLPQLIKQLTGKQIHIHSRLCLPSTTSLYDFRANTANTVTVGPLPVLPFPTLQAQSPIIDARIDIQPRVETVLPHCNTLTPGSHHSLPSHFSLPEEARRVLIALA